MPRANSAPQKRPRRTAAPTPGVLSGITTALNRYRKSGVWTFVTNTSRFTRSGLSSVGSLAWYFVASAMMVVFPIRRAVEMDIMMDEQRQAESQRFNPDALLPTVPGVYGGGSGVSAVPITAHY